MQFSLNRYEVGKVLDALDLAIDAEWMRPEKQAEFEDIKFKLEDQIPEPPPHGTAARYTSQSDPCRCMDCRLAHNEYMSDYRQRRRSVNA